VDKDCLKELKICVPVSYRIGNRECVKKAMARVLKSLKNPRGNSMYHFDAEPMRVCWKSCNLMESSINELDEHQRWKFIT
jgi:hypothetical protein